MVETCETCGMMGCFRHEAIPDLPKEGVTAWLVDAWWSLGRREEARELFVDALGHRNRYGLLSEDIDPKTGTLWGNFPQTYSMAGLILTAIIGIAGSPNV